ncbi:RNA-binding S4 domain-containing protein [Helicobacter pylori]|uniref:RNA-binding S4 domain-containing protein n=1 Tax=Helicobacter pylori TaxID=210 RepID=UPI00046DABAB|nr:RNA-binding S4 domain-containing protein [Helicobacter pylori]UOS38494.1 RNA-binding S4 domain-containing protein [Helicobacter pylori]WRD79610.1 RNA-binding S4 domain-containing protein [Helicobacter pylori]
MRIDKFLQSVGLVKRRVLATDMCNVGAVWLNGSCTKASKEVKAGDTISLHYLKGIEEYTILQIPTLKNVPRKDTHLYIAPKTKES